MKNLLVFLTEIQGSYKFDFEFWSLGYILRRNIFNTILSNSNGLIIYNVVCFFLKAKLNKIDRIDKSLDILLIYSWQEDREMLPAKQKVYIYLSCDETFALYVYSNYFWYIQNLITIYPYMYAYNMKETFHH